MRLLVPCRVRPGRTESSKRRYDRAAPCTFLPCTFLPCTFLLAIILIATPSANTLADQLVVRGQYLTEIEITGYSEGMIEFRTDRGDFDNVSIVLVESIQVNNIDGASSLNAAEELLIDERPRKAVEKYERALNVTDGFWTALVRARLVQAADEAYLFEKAVRNWLKITRRDAVTAALLIPQNIPHKPSPSTRRVLKKLERGIDKSNALKQRALLETLRFDTARRLGDAAARVLAAPLMDLILKAELFQPRTTQIFVAAGRLLIDIGEPAQTQRYVEGAIAEAPEELLPILLLLKSEALLASAITPEEYLSAALPAMRVVIHFPKHILASDGLVLAARAHQASGRTVEAKRLLDACIALDKTSTATKSEAAELLKRLGKVSKQKPAQSS